MKKRVLGLALLMGAAGGWVASNRELVKGVVALEKPQGEVFTTICNEDGVAYLCKNQSRSEDMLLDWVQYNGWTKADQVDEGTFFINSQSDTLMLNREAVLGGRYLLWRASRAVEA